VTRNDTPPLEDVGRRDHRYLGRALKLFTTHELIGAGLPVWLPRGAAVRAALERYIVEEERRLGYAHVVSPPLAKRELYEMSGHWAHFRDEMWPEMETGAEAFVLRPMNCPHHILVYDSSGHSYRDLPLRIAELGNMYRYERSGVLGGLSRVRGMTLNDGHIFCTPDQVEPLVSEALDMVRRAYATLGITDYWYRLSVRASGGVKQYAGDDATWAWTERMLRRALERMSAPYQEGAGEAAFYAPKLDVQVRDAREREMTLSTIQIDSYLPGRFRLVYIGDDGREHVPVMIHRSVVSTMERMVAHLVELYQGAFPVWLAPVQVVVLPVAATAHAYARRVVDQFIRAGMRAELDAADATLASRVRDAQQLKAPYIAVVGEHEAGDESVAVRLRTGRRLPTMPVERFTAVAMQVVNRRSLELLPDGPID
jgi:threonyl-tRNA synthetase